MFFSGCAELAGKHLSRIDNDQSVLTDFTTVLKKDSAGVFGVE